MIHTRLYRNGVVHGEGFPIAEVCEHLNDPSAIVWLDLCFPDTTDLETLSERLGLHELAMEDAMSHRQRPKLDTYDNHLFLTVYGVRLTGETLTLTEISIFVTENALITVRKNDDFTVEQITERWDANPELARFGVSFLLHGVLDAVVDGHFAVVEILDDRIEKLQDALFDDEVTDASCSTPRSRCANAWSPSAR